MRRSLLVLLLAGCVLLACHAQSNTRKNLRYSYRMVRLDTAWDAKQDPKLVNYVARQKHKLDRSMNEVIGKCPVTLLTEAPQSPLSNFLTDLLLKKGPAYSEDPQFDKCDLSMLNFGGIRSHLAAGDVTIGQIYAISPFDNYLVFIEIKGSELRKALERFTPATSDAPLSGAQITYHKGKVVDIRVQGEPLRDDQVYKLVTLNFISEGGDKLLSDIRYERVVYTPVIFRNFLIREIRELSALVTAVIDDRVIIQ